MKHKKLFFLLYFLTSVQLVYGYLDPGSGSYILQLIIGGGLAAIYTLKVYWKSVARFSKRLFSKKK